MQDDCSGTTAGVKTDFPLQGGRRPVTATGTAALTFETEPAISHLKNMRGNCWRPARSASCILLREKCERSWP